MKQLNVNHSHCCMQIYDNNTMAMWVDVYTRIYIILMSLSACSVASGLLCYTRPCLSSENNVCLKRCLELNATCSKKVTVNYGHHIVEEASCSPPLDNECSNEPRTCALKEINTAMYTSVTKVFSCCCKTDYCNGWFLDAIAIYPYLTLSRPLPLLPHTFTNHSGECKLHFYSVTLKHDHYNYISYSSAVSKVVWQPRLFPRSAVEEAGLPDYSKVEYSQSMFWEYIHMAGFLGVWACGHSLLKHNKRP